MELKFKDMDGVDEVTVTQIHVKVGQDVKKGDSIIDIEADKASDSIKSENDGKVAKIFVKEGDTLKSGDSIVDFGSGATDKSSPVSEPQVKPEVNVDSSPAVINTAMSQSSKVLATPLARKMARDLGIDITNIKGTGPAGRVLKDDLLKAKNGQSENVTSAKTANVVDTTIAKPTVSGGSNIDVTRMSTFGSIEHLPLSGLRKAIANQMSRSVYTAPHVSLLINVDAENLVQLRAILKEPAEKDSDGPTKLTFMPFFIKAVAKALKEERFKLLNSTLDINSNEILVKKYYNIGMAADTEKGLVVPVIKTADKLSLFEVARLVNNLGNKARSGSLKNDEMQGGTFTITNFGSAGIEFGTPIINYPEVAILGLGMMQKKLVIDNDKIVEHKFFPLSLSIDHRVIDGAPAGYFLTRLKELLENPTLILA